MSARIYSVLLSLYPTDLRRNFGAEMAHVFLEDLEHSYLTRGFFGAAGVWYRSLKELFRIALPARAAGRETAVALIMYVLEGFYIGAIMLSANNDPFASVIRESTGELIGAVMVWAIFPALIAVVALRVGDRSVPVPLNLRVSA